MRLSTRARLLPVAIVTLSALALAACGSSGPGDTGSEDGGETTAGETSDGGETDGAVTGGEASAWALTTGVHEIMWRESFEGWNAANPDKQIKVDWFANDAYKEKIRPAIGSGTAPTLVFGWAGGLMQEYIDAGAIDDITAGTEDVRNRILPSVNGVGTVDGKVYGIANAQSQPIILYYNKEVFESVGAEPPTTWEDLVSLVDVFKAEGIIPFALAGGSKWPELMWIEYLVDRFGGPEPFAKVAAGEADAWSDPAFTQALEIIQELAQAEAFGTGFATVVADNSADVALLHTGKAAMLLQGSWVYGTFKVDAPEFVSGGNLGFVNFPPVPGGTGDIANVVGNSSNYWYVSSAASEKAKADTIEYLNTAVWSDQYIDTLLDGGGVPPVAGLEDKIAATDDAEFLSHAYDLVKNAPAFTLSWDQAVPSAQAQELLNNLEQIFLLQITPQQFVDNMNATL